MTDVFACEEVLNPLNSAQKRKRTTAISVPHQEATVPSPRLADISPGRNSSKNPSLERSGIMEGISSPFLTTREMVVVTENARVIHARVPYICREQTAFRLQITGVYTAAR
jgi:hypothetical protein